MKERRWVIVCVDTEAFWRNIVNGGRFSKPVHIPPDARLEEMFEDKLRRYIALRFSHSSFAPVEVGARCPEIYLDDVGMQPLIGAYAMAADAVLEAPSSLPRAGVCQHVFLDRLDHRWCRLCGESEKK